jgi:glycosyltransferase involved in cell wall biosynthesis
VVRDRLRPAYQVASYIAAALDSVLAQTYQDHEIIVVNDGSPDTPALEAVLEPYRSRIIYLCQENRGLAGARNTGVRAARGRFIGLLDADDLWEPEFLSAQVALLESDPTLSLVYADGIIFGDSPYAGRKLMEMSPSEDEVTFERLVTRACTVHVCATLVRREALLSAGLFDESLRMGEDIDMWLRIMKSGGRIAHQRRALTRYRRRGDSLSANTPKMIETYILVLDKIRQHPAVTASERVTIDRERVLQKALLDLHLGKVALRDGQYAIAQQHLTSAQDHLKRTKLALALLLLRVSPSLARMVYQRREVQ